MKLRTSISTMVLFAMLGLPGFFVYPVKAAVADGGRIGFFVDLPNYDPWRSSICAQLNAVSDPARGGIGLDIECNTYPDVDPVGGDLGGFKTYSAVMGGYSGFPYPINTYLYDFFSSINIKIPGGANSAHISDPALDRLLLNFRFGSGSASDAIGNSTLAESYIFQHGYWFPLYVRNQYFAANNQTYTGYINWPGYGTQNPFWELQNVHNTNNVIGDNASRPLTVGMIGDVSGFNPLDTNAVYLAAPVIGEIFDTLAVVNPHTQILEPWLGTLSEGRCSDAMFVGCGSNGHYYTWNLFNNITWNDGVTLNATDVDWTAKLLQCQFKTPCAPAPLTASAFQHYVGEQINNEFSITLYYNETSYFQLYDAALPVYPKHVWSDIAAFMNSPSTYEPSTNATISNFLVGSGPFTFTSWIKKNAITLAERRVSTPLFPYYLPDPTDTNRYGGFIDTFSSTFPAAYMYHAPWINHIIFSVGLGGSLDTLARNLYTPNAENPNLDFAPWWIPSYPTDDVANIRNNIVTLGRGYEFTSRGNFGGYFLQFNLNEGVPQNTYYNNWGNGINQTFNPFADIWPTGANVGQMFRSSLNHIIDRNGVIANPCGAQCIPLLGAVSPAFGPWHNSSIDEANAALLGADYAPSKLNDTLRTMAGLGAVVHDSRDGYWHFLIPSGVPTSIFMNPMLLLPVLGVSAALLLRRMVASRKVSRFH